MASIYSIAAVLFMGRSSWANRLVLQPHSRLPPLSNGKSTTRQAAPLRKERRCCYGTETRSPSALAPCPCSNNNVLRDSATSESS
jgi:hypothetical protein